MKKIVFSVGVVIAAAIIGLSCFFQTSLVPVAQIPLEDSYWQVSQFEKAILALRGDSLEVITGASNASEHAKQSAVIALSKIRVLMRESSAQDVLLKNEKFSVNVKLLREFESQVLAPAVAAETTLDPARAKVLLEQLNTLLAKLEDLLPELWQLQVAQNELKFQTAVQRVRLNIILGTGLAIVALLAASMFVFFYFRIRDKNKELKLKNRELAQTIVEKNQFIGMVSHELKSPLQAITLSAESLTPRLEVSAQRTVIDRVQRAANQLNMQLNDLLTLVRSDEGQLEYRPDIFEVQGLIEEIVDIESPAAEGKKLKLAVNAPKTPVFAIADSGRLAQILRNLVSNAIKYTDEGSVEIRLESANPQALVFLVSDNGPGMPAGFEPGSMQPFRRYGAMDKREGYGIGLMIAYSLTQYLGGTLSFANKCQGTVFRLAIPAILQNDEMPGLRVTAATGAPLRVLLVDDRPELLASLRAACAAHGMDADEANSAAVAANMMATHHYDCALIDVNMPVRRGDELAQDFRRGSAMANRKCLLIGMSAERHPDLASGSPFHLMMDKPIHIKKLRRVLQRLGSN